MTHITGGAAAGSVYSLRARGVEMAGNLRPNSQGKLSVPAVIILAVLAIVLVPAIIRLAIGAMFTALHLAITVATLLVLLLVLYGLFRYLNKRS
jgi:amino acid transporter